MCSDNAVRPGSRMVTRRDLLAGAVASGAAALLAGCGGGSLFSTGGGGGGGGGLTQRAQTLTLNFDTAPVAMENAQPVNYVVSYTGNGLQSAFWGAQDASGLPKSILQALVWDTNADQGVRVTFDGRGLPATVVDLSSGAFVTCFWDADRAVFKFYQPGGQYIGGAAVSGAAPNFTVVQLADSVLVGLFVGDLQNTTDGIFSITVGGSARAAQKKAVARRGAARAQGRPGRAISTQLAPALTQLVKITGQGDYTPFAKALIGQLSSEYLSTGKSPTFALITQTALKNTGMSGLHLDDGLSIVRGVLAAPVLQQAASDMLTRTNAGEDLAAKDVVRYQASSPGLTVYASNADLPAPLPASDGTAVSGVMVSRDFGSIPVTGVIDASGNFTASGTAGGNIVTMTGQASGTTVSGTWTITQSSRASRAGGGSFNGNQQPIGQCQEQENSGGQGTFTNTYDLQKCGHFPFSYDAFTIPDHFQVLNGGGVIFDTGGPVSGGQTVDLSVSGASTLVTVVVYASLQGTAWVYTVGCPQ